MWRTVGMSFRPRYRVDESDRAIHRRHARGTLRNAALPAGHDAVRRRPVALGAAGRSIGDIPRVGGNHGDDAQRRGGAEPRRSRRPHRRSRRRLSEAARRELAAERVHCAHEQLAVVPRHLRGRWFTFGRFSPCSWRRARRCERTATSSICWKASTMRSSAQQRERQDGWQEGPRPGVRVRAQRPAGAGLSHGQGAHRERRRQPRVHQWTFNGMLALGRPEARGDVRRAVRERLWDAGRKHDALELAQRCRKLSPSFVPPAPHSRRSSRPTRARSAGTVSPRISPISRLRTGRRRLVGVLLPA